MDESAGSNYPLRGGKYSQFEGGIRSAAFVSGGFLPDELRGTQVNGTIHVSDWYTTFSTMVGVDPYDYWAEASGLPPVDGLDVWPMIMGTNTTSPHAELPISNWTLISGQYKLVCERSGHACSAYPDDCRSRGWWLDSPGGRGRCTPTQPARTMTRRSSRSIARTGVCLTWSTIRRSMLILRHRYPRSWLR